MNRRVIKMAVNNEVAIPIRRVVANPLIGPVPNTKSCVDTNPYYMTNAKS